MKAEKLIIGQPYLITLYNVIPGTGIKDKATAIYKGVITEETPITNEVHGFINKKGILCVLKEDIQTRVTTIN